MTGTLDKPKFSPDLQSVLRLQRQKLLPNLDNPTAAISDILRTATQKKEPGTEQQAAPKPADSIKSILNDFLKKK